jgi:hypothetical protein
MQHIRGEWEDIFVGRTSAGLPPVGRPSHNQLKFVYTLIGTVAIQSFSDYLNAFTATLRPLQRRMRWEASTNSY